MAGAASRENGKKGGRPPGALSKTTISALEAKAIAREVIREAVAPHIPQIVDANVDNAVGIYVMTIRHPDGTYTVADTVEQIKAGVAAGGTLARIYARQPNQQSAAMLLAYAADKPVEPVEHSGPDGGAIVVRWQGDE